MPTRLTKLSGSLRALLCVLLCVWMLALDARAHRTPAAVTMPSAASDVRVIPQPKEVRVGGEAFRFKRNTSIVLADRSSEDDRFAAENLTEDLRDAAGLNLMVKRNQSRNRILIGTLEEAAIAKALARVNVEAPANLKAEGYLLVAGANEIIVAGADAAGVFYGVQTLKQLVRGEGETAFVPGVRITDYPTMRWRAFSDDISRGPVPTLPYIKRQLKTFAALKMNMHSFYMEHTFASESNPLYAPQGGALTPAEIRELVPFARRLHIELVPEQQTFGHLHKALKFERYNELAEVPYGDVLSPQQPGSYKFVAELYKELDTLFPGEFFHIGADETFELGQGQSSEEAKRRGVGAIYFEHLNRVRDILKPYNRKLMFWGDIALNHPDLIGQIPKEMIVMNWAYGGRPTYAPRIKPFVDAGLQQFVCPGVQNWNQIFPNNNEAVVNIPNFVRDGQAIGALGMMNTSWDDDGETLFEMTWYGVALGAAAAWGDVLLDVEAFDDKFDWAFFRNDGTQFARIARALGGINTLLTTPSGMPVGASNSLFWQDPFTDNFQERSRNLEAKTREMRLLVERAEETLIRDGRRARRNESFLGSMRFATQRFDHLGRRMQVAQAFSRDYWDAYLNLGDRAKVNRLRRYTGGIYNALREMAEELTILRAAYREQWLAENRPYWLDSITARYDLAISTWLARSRQLQQDLREYEETSTLPSPDAYGLGARPDEESKK